MARYAVGRPILFIGRIDPICVYMLNGRGILRTVSNLTGKRVKKDPKFRRTMENARVLGRASQIGSFVYRELPKEFRQFWMYKAFTGEAIQLLREGKTDEEAKLILWKMYAELWVTKKVDALQPPPSDASTLSISLTSYLAPGETGRGRKKKTFPVLQGKRVVCKHEKESVTLPVIELTPLGRIIRRRRINRVECLIA